MKQQQSRRTKPKPKLPPNQARRIRKCLGTRALLALSSFLVFVIVPSSSIEFLCTPAEVSIRFRIPTSRSTNNNRRTNLLEKEEANNADNIVKQKSTTLQGGDSSSSTLVVFENDGLVLPDDRFESLAGTRQRQRQRQRHPFITAEIQGRSYPVRGMGGGNDRTSRLGLRLTFGNGDQTYDKQQQQQQQQQRHKNGPNRVPTRGLVKNEIRAVKHFSSDVMKRVRDVQLATKRHVYHVRASLRASITTVRRMIIPSSTSSSWNNRRRRHGGGVMMDEDNALDDTAAHGHHDHHHDHHGDGSSSRIGTLASTVVGAGGKITDQTRRELVHYTQRLMKSVLRALNDDALWTKVVHRDGVTVWRTSADVKNLHPDATTTSTSSRKSHKADATITAPKLHTVSDGGTIRTEAVLDAPPRHVYRVFMDDSLVSEYNDNCRELEDILHIDDRTKINWCATGKFGPFKARDFVTLVHFRELDNEEEGSYVQLASHVDEAEALCPPRTDRGYVRSQIRLAATFMRPLPGDPNKTHFVQLTQVGDLGGVADSAVAKKIKKRLEETSPVEFVKKFNEVLIRSLPQDEVRQEEEEKEEESLSGDTDGTEERRGEREGRNRPFFRLVDQREA